MNRRSFFVKSSAAAAAIAGLPLAIRKKGTAAISEYKSKLNSKPKETQYILSIDHTAVQYFGTAKQTEKVLTVKINYYEFPGMISPSKNGTFNFVIYKSEKIDQANNIWRVFAKLEQKISGEMELPSDFAKELKLNVKPSHYAEILSAKNTALVTMNYSDASWDDDEDCFLTTACVHHKQLADDCEELQTLRSLRDNYMLQNENGRRLVKDYSITGPAVVGAIRNFENRTTIYEYLYQQLVLPSVHMIKQGKKQEAVDYYASFVEALREKYL